MKKTKNVIINGLDFRNLGMVLLRLMGIITLSNKLPWGQTLPHQYLPLKKPLMVKLSIIKPTNKPNFGNQKLPTRAIKTVSIQPYFLTVVKVRLVLTK